MNGDGIAVTTTLVNGDSEAERMTASCGKQQLSDDGKEGKQDSETHEHLANSLSNGKAAIKRLNNVDAKEMATKTDHSGDEQEAMEVDSDREKENSDTNNAKGSGAANADSDDGEDVMCIDDEDGKSEEMEPKSKQTECGTGSDKSDPPSETAQVTDSKKDDDSSDCEVIDCEHEKMSTSRGKTLKSPETHRNSTTLPERRTPVSNSNNEASPSVTPSAGDSMVSTPAGSRSSTPSQAGTGHSQATTPVPSGKETPVPSGKETPKQKANSPTPGPSTSGVSPTPGTSASSATQKIVSPTSTATVSPKTESASAQSPSKGKPSKLDRMLPASYKEPDLRPMADLLVGIGQSLVYQQVYRDLVRVQRKKKHQKRLSPPEEKQLTEMEKLFDNSVEVNQPYHMDETQCMRCGFHTETETVLEMHKEFAHLGPGDVYLCSFCDTTTKNINTYFEHMLIAHKRKGRIHMKMSQHVCPLCPYDNSSKTVFSKHLVKCQRTFNMQRNLEPRPADSDIPLKKIKYVPPPQPRPQQAKASNRPAILKPYREVHQPRNQTPNLRPTGKTVSSLLGDMRVRVPYAATKPPPPPRMALADGKPRPVPPGMNFAATNSAQPQYVQLGGNFYCLMMHNGRQMLVPVINPGAPAHSAFTPRGQPAGQRPLQPAAQAVPQLRAPSPSGPRTSTPRKTPATITTPQAADPGFQVCEICGGFVKDQESLRVHFFWAHRTDIPKDIFNTRRPGINCRYCIERFWTRQGLLRHQRTKHPQAQPPTVNANPPHPKTYTCIVCNQKDIDGILEHLQSVHGISLAMQVNMKTCMVCGKALSSEEEIKQHLNQQHPGINKVASPAAATRTTPSTTADRYKRQPTVASLIAKVPTRPTQGGALAQALTKDVTSSQRGSSAQPFCTLCHIQFASVSQYLAHRNAKHSFLCPRCPNKCQYTTLAQMVQHYRTAHKGEQEPCPLCDAELNWGKDFIAHMTQKHLKKCSVAVERLSSKQLQKHQQQLTASSASKGDEVIVLEESRSPDSHLNGKQNSRKRKLREEIIEVDGEQVIVQQQDSDSD